MTIKTTTKKTKTVKISSKGQITLPKKILVLLNLKYGDTLEILEDENMIKLLPKKSKALEILSNLQQKIKVPDNLKGQDLDQIILASKNQRYKNTID